MNRPYLKSIALAHSIAWAPILAHERRVTRKGRGATMLEYALLLIFMGVLSTFLLKPFGFNMRWRVLMAFNRHFTRFPN